MPKGIKGFQKGNIPWAKGKTPWNKGKKGLQKIWSKGLTKDTNASLKIISLKLKGIPLSEETKKKLKDNNWSKKGFTIWNKGLTKETDERVKKYSKPRTPEQKEIYRLCQLGEKNFRFGKNLKELYGEARAKDISNKLSESRKLEKNPSWLGGKSFEPYTIEFNTQFRNEIRKRDNQICMNCGKHREQLRRALAVHHINYDKVCSIKENCICLCDSCHGLTTINREYWTKLFQEKMTKLYNYQYSQIGEIIINLK